MADEVATQAPPETWRPTRKWIAARLVALGALLTMWATTDGWNAEETVGLIGLMVEAGVSYLTPNNVATSVRASLRG